MNEYITIVLLLLAPSIYAQMQDEAIIIENKVIVFSEPNYSSDTIFTLKKNEVFLIAENDNNNNSDWVFIEMPRNIFSKMIAKRQDYYLYRDFFISGFVLMSKIILIDSLSKYHINDIGLLFDIVEADTALVIDEQNMRYGLEIPLSMSFVVKEMSLIWRGEIIPQDYSLFNDLFNVSFVSGVYSSIKNDEHFNIYNKYDYYFIKQKCADGAGSYEITWVIKDGKIIQRLIDTI